jgi:hypothetical protein
VNNKKANYPERIKQILLDAGLSISPVEISSLTESSSKIHSLVQHVRDPAIRNTEPAVVFRPQPLQQTCTATEQYSCGGDADQDAHK